MLRTILLAAFTMLSISACSSSDGLMPTTKQLSIPDQTRLYQSGDTRIGPLDLLKINVFGVSDLDGDYQVDTAGTIKMPLIGEVTARGYTAIEFSRELEARLGETYLQDPDVTVSIAESNSEQITVDGSVNNPGMYDVRSKLTLLQAIALSGGPSITANEKRVGIFRQIDNQRQVAVFDLKAIRSGQQADPPVYGNDIIIVDGNNAARENYRDIVRAAPFLALFFAF